MKKTMETPRLLNLLLLLCFAVSESAAGAGVASMRRRPGFLYSRTRGRCTPQFWSSRGEAWPRMVPETATVSKVFGSRTFERYRSEMTLMEATARDEEEEEAFARLLKEATAALLNSYARREFPLSAWEVKTLLIQALVSEEVAALQSQRFAVANESCN